MQELSSTQSKEHLTEPGSPKNISSDMDGDASKKEEKVAKEEKEQQPSTKKEKDPEKVVRQSESAESEGTGSNGGGSHDSV